jgi:hypothetical protein
LPPVIAVDVGFVERGGAVADPAVHHEFDGVEPEAVVAEAAAHADPLDKRLDLRLPLGGAEAPTRQAEPGANRQVAAFEGLVIGAQIVRVKAGIGDADQPERVEGARDAPERGDLLVKGRRRDVAGDHLFRAVAEESGWLAMLVTVERPGVGLRPVRVGCVARDPGQLYCLAVHHQLVPDAVQADRIEGRDLVQLFAARRSPLLQHALVPTAPDDPLARRRGRRPRRDARQHLPHRAAIVQADVAEEEAGCQHVAVGVDHARHDGATLQVNPARLRPGEPSNLVARADG